MFSALQLIIFVTAVSAEGSLRCLSGWSDSVREIPPSRVNDGYCDCPVDGSDETETGACSGSTEGGWAGVKMQGVQTPASSRKLQCPQQKSLILPPSRISDGLCDCCDGADEPPSSNCNDICDEVLAEERSARLKAEAAFAEGSKRRQEQMEEFANMVKGTTAEIEVLQKSDIPRLEGEVNSLNSQIRESKLRYATERIDRVRRIQSTLGFLGDVASADEIVSFIIASCQLAGEMVNLDASGNRIANQKTCIPLRLAGLDSGIMWENENFDEYSASVRYLEESDQDSLEEFATLLDKNSDGNENISFGKDHSTSSARSRDRKHHHRRPHDDDDDHMDDDEYPYEADDDYPGDYPGNEENDDEERKVDEVTNKAGTDSETRTEASEDETREKSREQVVKEAVHLNAVFLSRAAFKSRANDLMTKIMAEIDAIRERSEAKEEDEAEDGAVESGSGEKTAEDEGGSPPSDPMAIQMLSGSLSRRLRQLEHGEDFATSAKILIDALLLGEDAGQKKRELTNLAISTVYHGRLSAADVSEMFYTLIPELRNDHDDSDETCVSPNSKMCPPQTVVRDDVSLPPGALLNAAEALCEERSTASFSCSERGSSGDSDEGIPSSIADGYYGYYPPKSRGDDDVLNEHFSTLNSLVSSRTQTTRLEEEKNGKEAQLNEARSNLGKLEERIGGKEEQKFGTDGELYGIRDSCHKVESGKYEYELCIFGKATQRDKGQKGGGTNLGRWVGMKKDESTGERVMSWEKGTKCWNGPQRSATVFVTCGSETKVLTADEPRTCEYEMKMESHIACDDKFRESHGL